MDLQGKYTVWVKPKSHTDEYQFEGELLVVRLTAPAVENKANVALLKFLRKVSKRQVRIISGLTSRKKVVEFY